jgi:hypothetical protein
MLLVFLISLLLPYALAEEVGYTDMLTGEAGYASIFDGKVAVFGVSPNGVRLTDMIGPAQYCKADDSYVCIVSDAFVFAIPKAGAEITNSWSHSGARYPVTFANDTTTLLGINIRYKIIRQWWSGLIIDYAYSDKYGVIAIRALGGQPLILLDKCGFGAISDESGCLWK